MSYEKDKQILNEILLKSENIKDNRDEIFKIIPELLICVNCTQNNPSHIYNVYEHIEETVNKVDKVLILKLSALFHDIGKAYSKVIINGIDRFGGHEDKSIILTKLILKRLSYDDEIIVKVCKLIEYHDYKIEVSKEGVLCITRTMGKDLMPYLFKLKIADLSSHSVDCYNKNISKLEQLQDIYMKNFTKSKTVL